MRWFPAILWMLLIFLFSHQKGEGSGRLSRLIVETLAAYGIDLFALLGEYAFVFIRKAAHVTEYFILFQLLFLAIGKSVQWPKRAWVALAITVLYAASDEFHQTFIPKRTGLVSDVLIDSLGAVLGMLLNGSIRWLRRRSKKQ